MQIIQYIFELLISMGTQCIIELFIALVVKVINEKRIISNSNEINSNRITVNISITVNNITNNSKDDNSKHNSNSYLRRHVYTCFF